MKGGPFEGPPEKERQMEKKAVKITELDVQPLADEDLAAIAGSAEAGGSICVCVFYASDYWICLGEEADA